MIYGVNAVVTENIVAWAWAREDGQSNRSSVLVDVSGDLLAFGILLATADLLETAGQNLLLDVRTPHQDVSAGLHLVGKESAKSLFESLASGSPMADALWTRLDALSTGISIRSPWNENNRYGQLVRKAKQLAKPFVQEAQLDLQPKEGDADLEKPMDKELHVLAGTDGSRGRGRGTWAWVTSEGLYGWGSSKGTVDALELLAVVNLIECTPNADSIFVYSDSRTVADIAAGRLSSERLGGSARKAADRLLRVSAATSLDVQWVKGHNGHWLNETAHRLALYKRRLDEGEAHGLPVSQAVIDARVTNMFEEGRDALLRTPEARS